ncbi:hypothetical protein [Knoellia aerolata]|uniref:hypothetical protein n=1 Tax=Knoellia aerolata TaxID=442954 RepID=UPI0012ED54E5|nr:hypothetical protein [Knoellia aerolata]
MTMPAHAVALVILAVITAVVTHPLQSVAVQLMEGYWGVSSLARRAASARVVVHLRRRAATDRVAEQAERDLRTLLRSLPDPQNDYLSAPNDPRNATVVREIVDSEIAVMTAAKALSGYPEEHIHTMPTRLGNALRSSEALAGRAIGLDVIQWATHIGLSAAPEQNAYLNDQRSQLDLAVRMAAMGALAAAFTFVAFWPHGIWLLVALIPLTASWLSYRGAVAGAGAYGRAFIAWLHLNRFAMYEALRLPEVADADAERSQNSALTDLVVGNIGFSMAYRPSSPDQRPPVRRPGRSI